MGPPSLDPPYENRSGSAVQERIRRGVRRQVMGDKADASGPWRSVGGRGSAEPYCPMGRRLGKSLALPLMPPPWGSALPHTPGPTPHTPARSALTPSQPLAQGVLTRPIEKSAGALDSADADDPA